MEARSIRAWAFCASVPETCPCPEPLLDIDDVELDKLGEDPGLPESIEPELEPVPADPVSDIFYPIFIKPEE